MGIIAGMMAGAGEGLQKAGVQFGDYLSKSKLQEEAAEIQRLRDERLHELRKGEIRYAEDLRREPGRLAQEDIEKKRGELVEDPSGLVRPKSAAEIAKDEEDAYRKHGLVNEAMAVRQTDMQRQRDLDAKLDRQADNERASAQLEETKRHNKAVEDLQRATEGRLRKVADMDAAIKQITLDNAKRVEALRKEYGTASPARQNQIREEIQLLTGKDNDNFLPVPLKDEMGAITGYKVFDKKAGRFVDQPGTAQPGQGGQGGKGERPPLSSFFKNDKPKDAPAAAPSNPAAGASTPPAPAAQPRAASGGRDRDMELEARDPTLKALALSLQSKDANENTRAWIAYTNRLKELRGQ